ncbi:ribonuclease D [Crossiella sp. CA-258035]|uniref:ribonuclease D n=1 Tax=Crossiella sp. CA-258035 TaxID=2981138 RepID=UPI0024BC14A3|nr:ribonuclease D [Crossiella sp. CA-258035]WHT21180.1 ribonuclease D [Crossiella sp. CA-258035]
MPDPEIVEVDINEWQLRALTSAGLVACDIETTGLDWATDQIATCQIHSPMTGTFVARIGVNSPSNLCQLIADPTTKKIFHHAPFDLRFMVSKWGVKPANIACTKVASRLLDPYGDKSTHSLQSLLDRILGVQISKDQRLSNWQAVELSAEQLAYAAADVEYLIPLYKSLSSRLNKSGLSDLFAKCCSFLPTHVDLQVRRWPDVFAH